MSTLPPTTLAHYRWKDRNPEGFRASQKRYKQSAKGKAALVRARNNPKYRPARLAKHRDYMDSYRLRQRDLVFAAYGNKCACCGESNKGFLTADHIDKLVPEFEECGKKLSGWVLYGYLIRHNFPPGYQLLCANCNMGLEWWGVCPHKQEPY